MSRSAVAAFFAARALQPPAAAQAKPEPPAPPAPPADPGKLRDAFTAEWWNRMTAVAELRTFLDATRNQDAVANDNGEWRRARRASGQPALRSIRSRGAAQRSEESE